MSSEVKAVSGAFKDVLGRSKAKAGAVADKMQKTLKELDQALDMADELADGYAADAAELRGVLASLSNFAPSPVPSLWRTLILVAGQGAAVCICLSVTT